VPQLIAALNDKNPLVAAGCLKILADVPLLKEMASHDLHIERLMVQGKPVAHFKNRQRAAKAIAEITQQRAAYLATFIVDRIQSFQFGDKPRNDLEWTLFNGFAVMAMHLDEQFGAPVLVAIREEAARRKIDVTQLFPKSRLSWASQSIRHGRAAPSRHAQRLCRPRGRGL
jgi:hypothetical protein